MTDQPRTIELEDVRRLLERDHVVIWYLPEKYFDRGHLPGAKHLPLATLEAKADRLIPDQETTVVVYCAGPTCENSHEAADRLAALGFSDVCIFPGGKKAWRAAGLDLEVTHD